MKLRIKNMFFVAAVGSCYFISLLATSCSQPSSYQKYYDYIYDRTFTIGEFYPTGGAGISGISGTGWLFERLSGSSDYTYYMFTNWHVQEGMKEILEGNPGAGVYYSFADDSNNDSKSIGYISIPDANFDWVGTADYYQNVNNKDWGVDAAVARISFNTFPPGHGLKDRLDRLNTYAEENENMLVKFHDQKISGNEILHMAGYPGADWNETHYTKTQWEAGSDNIGSTKNYWSSSGNPNTTSNGNHNIDGDTPATAKYWSMSDRYVMKKHKVGSGPLFKIGPGASGSMAINNDYEVVGLYWGGLKWTDNKYEPCIEVFSNGLYNLYSDFKTGTTWHNPYSF